MNNQYFVPQIEDIRVGYEAEANIRDRWLPFIFQGVGQEVIEYHKKGIYRVPYLTKEQIEAKGWEFKESKYPLSEGVVFFRKDNFMLLTDFRHTPCFCQFFLADISLEDRMPDPERWRVCLPIKDINTFRYICKLLNIN